MPPGYLLATQTSAVSTTYNLTATLSLRLILPSATLAFTVPASGNVDVVVQIDNRLTITTNGGVLVAGILNHSGGAQLGKNITLQANGNANSLVEANEHRAFPPHRIDPQEHFKWTWLCSAVTKR